ncbi:TPA: sel1 repeat family protein [Acinetobacter baumannii]|nr:sel1 repeat family protein [Acinetobacter baumannii]
MNKFIACILVGSSILISSCSKSAEKLENVTAVSTSNPSPEGLPALAVIQEQAKNGDSQAQYNLGLMYKKGVNGVNIDLEKAIYWYKKAIEQGDDDAKYNLAIIYATEGTEFSNPTLAFKLLSDLSQSGHKEAINYLGILYRNGIGVKKDYNKAFNLFEKAVSLNVSGSKFNLGNMYFNGYGTEVDYKKAAYWFDQAVRYEQDAYAAEMLGGMFYEGRGVEKNINKSLEFYQIAADQGDKDAAKNIEIIKKECGC